MPFNAVFGFLTFVFIVCQYARILVIGDLASGGYVVVFNHVVKASFAFLGASRGAGVLAG